ERILTAAVAILSPARMTQDVSQENQCPAQSDPVMLSEEPELNERVRALLSMLAHGLDEQTVTLTFVRGIGGKTARKLRTIRINDVEDLAAAEIEEITQVSGISSLRAVTWIREAQGIIKSRSAYAFRETALEMAVTRSTPSNDIDLYRLGRAQDLHVKAQ